jgi:hypothetical protein
MWSFLPSRLFGHELKELPAAIAASATEAFARTLETLPDHLGDEDESTTLRTIGWVSAGLGAVAIGLFVGRELRQRYKFNRRTPYDFYAHSGDEMQDNVEFGVGV